MAPNADAFPPPRAWLPSMAKLRWKYDKEKGFVVKGFGRDLACVAPSMRREREREREREKERERERDVRERETEEKEEREREKEGSMTDFHLSKKSTPTRRRSGKEERAFSLTFPRISFAKREHPSAVPTPGGTCVCVLVSESDT